MSKLLSRLGSFFSSRTFMGVDKTGNKYFTRKEEVDGIMKEKRWVIFKGEDDPTSIPVEWICWLNGQRKKAPTPEEMADLEARRERVKLNVALLKKEEEEEERKSKEGSTRQSMHTVGKVGGPDLNSFIRQFPADSTKGDKLEDEQTRDSTARNSKVTEETKPSHPKTEKTPKSSEPKGSGQSFQPGTWQPPV